VVCTLENAAAAARCDACDTARPDLTPAAFARNPPTPPPSAAPPSTFTILTLNLWFDSYHGSLRMRRVALEVRRLQPDILCLQEVTPQLLSLLEPPLRELGYCTRSLLLASYGEMLWWRAASVSSVQLSQDAFHDSQQGRQLHVARCMVRGRPLAVATVHLESEAHNSAVRLAQLGRTLRQLQGIGMPFVLAGDTNLGKKDDAVLSRDKTIMGGASDGGVLTA
jgi:endonuclease/exonuclease/phosphatase family metal-dependent hydrolase